MKGKNKIDDLFYEKNNNLCVDRKCPNCDKVITLSITNKNEVWILRRNYQNFESKKRICRTCSKSGNKNSFYGKKHTSQTVQSISINRTGKCLGVDNPMSNPVHRQKAIDSITKLWQEGKMEHVRKMLRDQGIELQSSGKIKQTYISKGEDNLFNFLKINLPEIEIIRQKTIHSKHFDLFLPVYNLLIEYNGDYWHCNPTKYDSLYFNKKKQKYAYQLWEYDKNKLSIAHSLNYITLVVWESEFKRNPNLILKQINNTL